MSEQAFAPRASLTLFAFLPLQVLPGSIRRSKWPGTEQRSPKCSPSPPPSESPGGGTGENAHQTPPSCTLSLVAGAGLHFWKGSGEGATSREAWATLNPFLHHRLGSCPEEAPASPLPDSPAGQEACTRGRSARRPAAPPPPSRSRGRARSPALRPARDLQKNSATISALPRRVMPCSRESCSAMARPTDAARAHSQTAAAAARSAPRHSFQK